MQPGGRLMLKIVLMMVFWSAVMAALVMVPARSLAYPGAWVFVATFFVEGLAITLWMAKHSPSLLRERMSPPIQKDQKPWDRIFLVLLIVGFLAWMAFMGWDAARTGFDAVPLWLQALGGVLNAAYMAGVWWTFRENAFAAPVVKIQAGQTVIDTGPYAHVRHPMYASALLFFLGLPLLLGSWLGLVGSAVLILAIACRAVGEEAALREGLAGYDAYAARVRYRLIPGIW
jgi:protein-S-isoprenylcysteine O-methyltransferase Ste14